ncbi:hypothetical protein H9P43_002289 [Blastocladiella emersonii ATCC 22665]|nr:hypothetical protein H9P43_002289 [Blastocladiella emersonii ATCC 22665]
MTSTILAEATAIDPVTAAVHAAFESPLPESVVDWIAGTVQDARPGDFGESPAESLSAFFSPVLLDAPTLTAAAHGTAVKPPPAAKIRALCDALVPYLGVRAAAANDDEEDDEAITFGGVTRGPGGPRRLAGGPVHMNALEATTQSFMPGVNADITHAGNRKVTSRVDAAKLEKAELKLKAKMAKRDTDIEVSFKTIDRPKGPQPISDAQIKDILAARGKSNDIHLSNFDISVPGLRILTGANLSLVYGRRYGLVGVNGVGKSTTLRGIANRDIPGMEKFKHVSIGYVEQDLQTDDTPCLECVVKADIYRAYLLRQENELNGLLSAAADGTPLPPGETSASIEAKLKQVYQKLDDIEASTAEARAGTILSGLGFSREMQKQPFNSFSGGWRMRVALARSLFTRPDLLLLDEPTNHLDIPAVVWLSKYLSNWPSTLVVVSHDREFLDVVATDIMHQHNERIDVYRGNFSDFERTSDERRKQAQREYDAQMQHRQHLQAFVDRWRYNAKRASQAQARMKILEKLPELEVPTEDIQVTFQFPDPEKLSPPILQLDSVSFGYSPDKPKIFTDVSLDIQMTSRVALVGPNGAGKTTALNLLTGALEPTSGRVFRNGRLRFAYFAQHHVDTLEDLSLTPVQFLGKHFPGYPDEEYRRQLGCFGISGRVGLQAMGTLSGGQKSRVVFASLALQRAAVLILDEPTNHLDYMSVDSLAEAVRNFKGGVLIVSHDQRFIDMCCNEIWVCADGRLRKFEGDTIAQYRETLDIPE